MILFIEKFPELIYLVYCVHSVGGASTIAFSGAQSAAEERMIVKLYKKLHNKKFPSYRRSFRLSKIKIIANRAGQKREIKTFFSSSFAIPKNTCSAR